MRAETDTDYRQETVSNTFWCNKSGVVQATLFWKHAAEHRPQAYRQHAEHSNCGMQCCPAAVTVEAVYNLSSIGQRSARKAGVSEPTDLGFMACKDDSPIHILSVPQARPSKQ